MKSNVKNKYRGISFFKKQNFLYIVTTINHVIAEDTHIQENSKDYSEIDSIQIQYTKRCYSNWIIINKKKNEA